MCGFEALKAGRKDAAKSLVWRCGVEEEEVGVEKVERE